jgi:hypothetical protein
MLCEVFITCQTNPEFPTADIAQERACLFLRADKRPASQAYGRPHCNFGGPCNATEKAFK